MGVMWTNKDVANVAETAGRLIKLGFPKYVDKKIMIKWVDDTCNGFVNGPLTEEYEAVREVMQEISNRFLHNLLEAADKTIEYYKTVAETTEGAENE